MDDHDRFFAKRHRRKELGRDLPKRGATLYRMISLCIERGAVTKEAREAIALEIAKDVIKIWEAKDIGTTKPSPARNSLIDLYAKYMEMRELYATTTAKNKKNLRRVFKCKCKIIYSVKSASAENGENITDDHRELLSEFKSKNSEMAVLEKNAFTQARLARREDVEDENVEEEAETSGSSSSSSDDDSSTSDDEAEDSGHESADIDATLEVSHGSTGETNQPGRPSRLPPIAERDEGAGSSSSGSSSSSSSDEVEAIEIPSARGAEEHRDLVQLMHVHSQQPEVFRDQLSRTGWPASSDWADYELLKLAVQHGYEGITLALLRERARAVRDGHGPEVFHRVVAMGWLDTARMFMDRGALVQSQDDAGNTALHVAFAKNASPGMMQALGRQLVDKTNVVLSNSDGLTTWHLLCAAGSSAQIVRDVLAERRNYVDVDSQVLSARQTWMTGCTALHFAVMYDRLETVQVLLENNANVHTRDRANSTPLHLACRFGFTRLVDELLAHDRLREDLIDNQGLSYFMCACSGTHVQPVQEFLRAAEAESRLVTRAMVLRSVKKGPFAGRTALDFAKHFHRVEITELLMHWIEVVRQPIPATSSPIANRRTAVHLQIHTP